MELKMPGNGEERQKCLEKLNQMQKFIPFLDFMIEKISKKNNEIPLECQLSKLQVLRSMIVEKSEKYSWEIIVKVEDVIQRLISKLDMKDRYEKSEERLNKKESQNCKTSMATSVSIVPSSATTVSVTASSNSQSTAVDVKPQEFSTKTVDLIMKTLKMPADKSANKITDRGNELLSNRLGPNQPLDVSGKLLETDLDKDLDGYDLTDCPDLSETSSSNAAVESVNEIPEKVTPHDDLLSSSREKLLKSLQNKLFPCRTYPPPSQSPIGDKPSESQLTSAFSQSQISLGEQKAKSGFSDPSDNNSVDRNKTGFATSGPGFGKRFQFSYNKSKGEKLPEKPLEPAVKTSDISLKQRLKEKLSTDICEVYRVPGKSVGGSLRSLKESKDVRKCFSKEEEELFKPDVILEKGSSKHGSSQSRSSQRSSSPGGKSERDSAGERLGERSSDEPSHKNSLSNRGRNDKRSERHNSKSSKDESESRSRKNEPNKSDTGQEKMSDSSGDKSLSKKIEDKNFALDKLNDDELLEFVKENMQTLPHLAKLKSSELRKAVQSSIGNNFATLDADAISEISDDSFQDFDSFISDENKGVSNNAGGKSESTEVHPLASVKIAQIGPDGVAKNVKPIVEPSEDVVHLEEVGDRTDDMDVSFDNEDYVLKLIEETTPKTYPNKKKGSLELPTSVTDDLFDDISSVESFETSTVPSESRDPRITKLLASSDSKNKSEYSRPDERTNSPDPSKPAREAWSASNGRPGPNQPNQPKDSNHISRVQSNFGAVNAPSENYKSQWNNQDRPDPFLGKPSHCPQGIGQNLQPSCRYPMESNDYKFRYPVNPSINDPRRHSYLFSEPKSYGEYRRMKEQQQKQMVQNEQASKESGLSDASDASSRSLAEKVDVDGNAKKNQDHRQSGYKDPVAKQNHPKTHQPVRTTEGRKTYSKQWRHSEYGDVRERRSTLEETKKEDEKAKKVEEKRYSSETEELVSPLEELYRSQDKPKTGRGYGIQNFKIPKKVREPTIQRPTKPSKNQTPVNNAMKSDQRTESSNAQCEIDSTKTVSAEESEISQANVAELTKVSVEECKKKPDQSESSDSGLVDSTVTEDVPTRVESSVDCSKTDSSITENDAVTCDRVDCCDKSKVNENPTSESVGIRINSGSVIVEPKTSDKTDALEQTSNPTSNPQEEKVNVNGPGKISEGVGKKCEAQMVECDSSVEASALTEQSSEKDSVTPTDKVMQKEEITQEFVEALIRKSFQSGEGKLLLAQVKLFEKLARKLNSKKLKTIQKIINSESGSSSSSSESSSEDERRRKKSKKSEQKSKKRKKRGKKSRKHKLSSSSSASESEESSEEENYDKKDVKTGAKKNESSRENPSTSEEIKSESNESSGLKTKKHSGRKAKQKQNQSKLLDEVLDGSPQPEGSAAEKSADVLAKQPERRKKKGKTKTELDRLHDDIRSMFISAGVVTATGRRMCRILKQSGGNMNDLDIVKESAKMVEEEKLKKAQSSISKNLRPSNSGSQTSDSAAKVPETQEEYDEEDPKLRLTPRVSLQRVDLDNFGYGIKVSEDCISFRRMKGRNTAIRGAGMIYAKETVIQRSRSPLGNVFLARNKRKFERLRDSKRKKSYTGKKLMDIVQNLPLKMAKMKHLQLCERKVEIETFKKKKSQPEKNFKKIFKKVGVEKRAADLNNFELQNYAFEKKRRAYICKLCNRITRNITAHYIASHPEHEVLISRLSLKEAESAKLESEKDDSSLTNTVRESFGESTKQRGKPSCSRTCMYHCRMCDFSKATNLNTFAAHVSIHTGEYRYLCPSEGCGIPLHSRDKVKFHIFGKHFKARLGLYKKVIHLYPLNAEGDNLYGYLCSLCHYVQIRRCNLERHVSLQHNSSDDANILKINMSSGRGAKKLRKAKKSSKEELSCSDTGSDDGESENSGTESDSTLLQVKTANENGKGVEVKKEKRKQRSEDENSKDFGQESDVELLRNKRIFIDESVNVINVNGKPENEEEVDVEEGENGDQDNLESDVELKVKGKTEDRPVDEEEVDVEGDENGDQDNLDSDVEMEDCVDLKDISTIKGSDIISSVETSETSENSAGQKLKGNVCQLQVGPLAAVLSPNSEVLYECFVKGCLFSTGAIDLFEKHIKISHWKTKWDGICEICAAGKDKNPQRRCFLKLLTALNHLKLHAREKSTGGNLTREDLIMELKLLSPSEDNVEDNEDSGGAKEIGEMREDMAEKSESSEAAYPVKPLLRVRNLLGDRLSTPKPDGSDVVTINEEESNSTESSTDSSKMFTIENVRSLNDAPTGESEIKIEQICSLQDLVSKPAPPSGQTIIVRSCPTRKIAIRPKPNPLSVDVGTINVVQPPVVGHPVVLSPLSGSSPIRIISTAKPTFSVNPIVVSTDAIRLNAPNLMPVISPSLAPAITTSTILPINASENCLLNTADVKAVPVKRKESVSHESSTAAAEELIASKIGLDVEVIPAPARPKTPPAPSTTIQPVTKNSSSDAEDAEEKDTISPQKFASSPSTGKKSVKDAKIYKEMLTKTKLCHLFKCMGIECSFTCNNENVFTQHIGLHEAQRRLKRNKGLKTIYLRSANKITRAFYWQQCAYCCEVLSNTNKALSHHILEEHGHCMYQCAFCFYRAVSHCYVEIHQNLAHSQILKTSPRVIYKCKPLKVPPSQAVALEKHGRKQSVRPYHCDQCGRKFYITNEFTTHLQTEHQSVTAYTCHICKNLCFKVNRLINHYKLHSYSTYQCAYCLHGTETEKEMVFHLCNFHFSQPAVMYVRALAEGQSGDENQKPNKKKKQVSNQLDSLKVIIYEGDNPNLDCIVEADPDEEIPENVSESSLDLTSIVEELGICTDSQSSTNEVPTPLMKELASIGGKATKHLTVKTLLPNAQFSSENENGTENCSVLISSGLSVPSDPNNEREMSIPLGQLPLEAVNVQTKETASSSPHPNNAGPPDKNLKLNEIIVNLQHKDKSLTITTADEEKAGQPTEKHSSAVHKLPPVVLGRCSTAKNAYPSKSAIAKKKQTESQSGESGAREKSSGEKDGKAGDNKTERSSQNVGGGEEGKRKPSTEKQTEENSKTIEAGQPRITEVVSLSSKEFEKEESESTSDSIIVSDILSTPSADTDNSNSSELVISDKSNADANSVLKPPIIRVEDFPVPENPTPVSSENMAKVHRKESVTDKESGKTERQGRSSPDIIILENVKEKDIVTVTLDSDDEKEESVRKKKGKNSESLKPIAGGETIRQEMELLRNQIANETDSLLDEPETEKPTRDLTLSIRTDKQEEQLNAKTLLSPIEEAICSLNKKLESESQEAQKKEEEEQKEKVEVTPRKSDANENKLPERPRTRFGRRKEGTESSEKQEGDDGSTRKEPVGKFKRFKGELLGKDLFICGNEKCNFAAEDDALLKDHLYVCDLSRESSVLVCPHCSRQIKQFRPYLEHLKYHGEKKYHCGLCQFSSAVDLSVTSHVKLKHKCAVTKILPKDSKEGHFVCYPKNYKVEKVDFEVNGYSPGDEDKLPLQSVYQVNVKCAKCPYFTKVRSNMVRHLKIHVKSVETEGVVVVPSTAPTNPVPCLETKERMFDKMTNLAASSQLAQAKEKTALESLSPEEEAKLPQFVTEQMRYKCCLPDCNYITVDDGMLKHHIKALHDEISYYSCPHCRNTVHVDVRHVTLDKIGFHLKHHDSKLYKCAHCIYFHYQKNVVEKHTAEKHPDRRYFVHVVREPKLDVASEEEPSSSDGGARVWKCGLCDDFQTPSKPTLMDHLLKTHNTKSKYKCKLCPLKGNSHQTFSSHFASKHSGEKVSYMKVYYSDKAASGNIESQSGNSSGADSSNEHFDTTPLWQRGAPRIRHIRGILIEEEEIKTKKSKKGNACESEAETSNAVTVNENAFYCPLCTNKKKPFYTRNEDCFRTHLYQELNYQQFACILCGKMFVDKKDFDRHHSRVHADKPQSLKQTKEDHEIKFWVDQVIAKQRNQMEERKRKLSETETSENPGPPKKKKEV